MSWSSSSPGAPRGAGIRGGQSTDDRSTSGAFHCWRGLGTSQKGQGRFLRQETSGNPASALSRGVSGERQVCQPWGCSGWRTVVLIVGDTGPKLPTPIWGSTFWSVLSPLCAAQIAENVRCNWVDITLRGDVCRGDHDPVEAGENLHPADSARHLEVPDRATTELDR